MLNVGIFLFEGVEPLDFVGPLQVFGAARTTAEDLGERLCQVVLITEQAGRISTRYSLTVEASFTIENHPPLDVLVIPGGQGVPKASNRQAVLDWLIEQASQVQQLASVCTGAFLLAQAGLLEGMTVTTHWASLERLAMAHPSLNVITDVPWVQTGKIITAAGVSAGIDMSLHCLVELFGEEVATATARAIEYAHWPLCNVPVV